MALAAWFRSILDTELDALLRNEVNDLAKLNLVMLMRRERGLAGDAAFFAQRLGFHSVELTELKLRQLAACGLVVAQTTEDDRTIFALTADETARRRLGKLWKLTGHAAHYTSLIHHLAERSIDEADAYYQKQPTSAAAR